MEVMAWLLALSFAGGSDLLPLQLGGATLYAFRFVVMVLGGIALVDVLLSRTFFSRWLNVLLGAMAFWIIWSLMPWYSIVDYGAFQKDVFYLVIGLCTLLSIGHLVKLSKEHAFIKATIAGLLVNLLLGVFQILTSIQPESAHVHALEHFSSEHFVRFAPVGMFGNPNHYAFYLMVNLLLLAHFRKQLHAGLTFAVGAIAGIMIFLTASKLAVLSVVLLSANMAFEERQQVVDGWRRYRMEVLGAVVLGLVLLTTIDWKNTRQLALQQERINVAPDTTHTSSYDARGGLVSCAITAIGETSGLGLGPGQFPAYLERPECTEKTGGIVNAHSGVLEIVAQYGVLLMLLIGSIYLSLPFVMRQTATFSWSLVYAACLGLLQAANSSFLASPVAWMMLALPVIILKSSKSTS
jgi:hypothetical protein